MGQGVQLTVMQNILTSTTASHSHPLFHYYRGGVDGYELEQVAFSVPSTTAQIEVGKSWFVPKVINYDRLSLQYNNRPVFIGEIIDDNNNDISNLRIHHVTLSIGIITTPNGITLDQNSLFSGSVPVIIPPLTTFTIILSPK